MVNLCFLYTVKKECIHSKALHERHEGVISDRIFNI